MAGGVSVRVAVLVLAGGWLGLCGCSQDASCKQAADCPEGFVCEDGACKQDNGNPDVGMVEIPAGACMLGCNAEVDSSCDPDENPYREVSLSAYRIDLREVSNSDYQACIDGGGCTTPGTDASCSFDPIGRAEHPVTCVTWAQAREYCTFVGKRLPTEAEWEKAARGPSGQMYPWGDSAPDCNLANHADCQTDSLPVGSLPAGQSPYGLFDMAGNVYEWVLDFYGQDYYQTGPTSDPQGPETGTHRVMRGGAWGYDANYLRSSNRGANEPGVYRFPLGLRCAKTVGG